MEAPEVAGQREPSRVKALLQLFRLPNVFTAVADVAMGYLFTHVSLQPAGHSAALIGASVLMYTAGMVLNDVFDFDVDHQERPERPLPSGRIRLGFARLLGWELLVVGLALGWLASGMAGGFRSGLVATALAAAIVLYDGYLKRTPLGPLGMGACRMLNVLMGMSLSEGDWTASHLMIAGGIGLYIVGLTWFAKSEAATSHRGKLLVGTLVMSAGISIVALFPLVNVEQLAQVSRPGEHFDPTRWTLLWTAIALLIGRRCAAAIVEPTPALVQAAVKHGILSLIVIDAAVVYSARGAGWAALVVLLMVPTLFLGRWIYST